MKLQHTLLTLLFATTLLASCSKGGDMDDDDGGGPGDPVPGSKRTIEVDLTYEKGLIENSTSYAIWPVIKFPVDAKVKNYKVKLHGFNGIWTNAPEGKTYTWKHGDFPPTDYNIWESNHDMKDGNYYLVIGRTWCAGCTAVDPLWEQNYRKGYGTPKGEVTYQY
jgi:hypothetical protein